MIIFPFIDSSSSFEFEACQARRISVLFVCLSTTVLRQCQDAKSLKALTSSSVWDKFGTIHLEGRVYSGLTHGHKAVRISPFLILSNFFLGGRSRGICAKTYCLPTPAPILTPLTALGLIAHYWVEKFLNGGMTVAGFNGPPWEVLGLLGTEDKLLRNAMRSETAPRTVATRCN